ncbi:hypothetical protein OPQ81_003926 [Rhizoctonia solani]|nr:hypothetical protein OPQ81_003926 [Rhizoctonia solani]
MVARKAVDKRALVICLKNQHLSDRAVAEKVKDISYVTVNQIYKDYLAGKDVFLPRCSTGRPCKMTKPEAHWGALIVERGLVKSAAELQHEYFPHLSISTVQRRLIEMNYQVYK